MFHVHQSDSGQYVVVHPPSNTVMVGDDIAVTFAQMRAHVDGLQGAPPAPAPASGPPRAWTVAIAALALLPFLWLGALHVSLGRLVAELRVAGEAGSEGVGPRLERLEREVESLERALVRRASESPAPRPTRLTVAEPAPAPAPGAAPAPRRSGPTTATLPPPASAGAATE